MGTVLGNVGPITSEYSEVARRALDARQCALIVVDIQEKLLPPIMQKEQLLKNSQLLIRLAGIFKIPTVMSTQYAKGLGERYPKLPPFCRTCRLSTNKHSPALAAMSSAPC